MTLKKKVCITRLFFFLPQKIVCRSQSKLNNCPERLDLVSFQLKTSLCVLTQKAERVFFVTAALVCLR